MIFIIPPVVNRQNNGLISSRLIFVNYSTFLVSKPIDIHPWFCDYLQRLYLIPNISYADLTNILPGFHGVPSHCSNQRSPPHQPAVFHARTSRIARVKSRGFVLAAPAIM